MTPANASFTQWTSSPFYTVIRHNNGLEALKYFLDKRPVLDPPTATLTCLAELVLTLNAVLFNNEFYHQVRGVAMGSKMGWAIHTYNL